MAEDEAPNPFNNPLFAQFQRAMSAQGPLQWDVARQTALMAATEGVTEHNVDPQRRIAVESLANVARMHVAELTGLATPVAVPLDVVGRATWANLTLQAWKPYFDALAQAIGGTANNTATDTADTTADNTAASEADESDPMMAMLANVSKLIAPSMLGMSVGTLVGRLATNTFGQFDLPLPRDPHDRVVIVISNVDSFADEWSIPRDDMTMWALTHELVSHGVFGVAHVRQTVQQLVSQFAGGFRPNPGALSESISSLDISSGDPMKLLNSLLSDPTVLLGAQRSAAQERVAPILDAAIAGIVGYIDHYVDRVTARILGQASPIGEAVRRRRVAQSGDRVFVERLLGVDLTSEQVERAQQFIAGVLERAGDEGVALLLAKHGNLPTPSEIVAPGLWLARLETSN
ncbi:MAG: zinc-dependent metalloprotease [Ilumatobacteraceae bacterium]|nr:zinc-dependent metalloprotease [Ilumatobacteraceae bacterium]MDP4930386.1 zinc-dependent metalloprotease [Ilumatobacteraceae bacterium]